MRFNGMCIGIRRIVAKQTDKIKSFDNGFLLFEKQLQLVEFLSLLNINLFFR